MSHELMKEIYVAGIISGLILVGALLLHRRRSHPSMKILIGLLLTIILLLTQSVLYFKELYTLIKFTYWPVMSGWFVIPPLMYMYFKTFIPGAILWKPRYLLYFAIPLYIIIEWLINLLGVPFNLRTWMASNMNFNYLWLFVFIASNLYFTGRGWKELRRLSPSDQDPYIRWLQNFAAFLFLVNLIFIAIWSVFFSLRQYSQLFDYSLLLFYEIFIFVLIFKIFQTSVYFPFTFSPDYANTSLTSTHKNELHERVKSAMEGKQIYLQSQLSLAQLAQEVESTENQLSQLFNQHLETNFYKFVNGYRLKAFESRLLDAQYKNLTIIAIAESCGFRSKASFYNAFKEKHNMTPKAYWKEQASKQGMG
ncbi:MAG: AraC family transcriptional regulator [Bacteroidota bacterium]